MLPIVTNEAAILLLTAKATALANLKIRLFTDALPTLDATTTKAAMVTAEANYTGYLAITVATLPLPYLVPGNGANLQVPTQQFQPTGTAVANQIRGWWVETATGDIQLAGRFDADITMADVTNAIPLDIIFRQPNQ